MAEKGNFLPCAHLATSDGWTPLGGAELRAAILHGIRDSTCPRELGTAILAILACM